MPPNRKGNFDAVDSLATLQVSQFVDRAKYQPLTAPRAETSQVSQTETVKVEAPRHHDDHARSQALGDSKLEPAPRDAARGPGPLLTAGLREREAGRGWCFGQYILAGTIRVGGKAVTSNTWREELGLRITSRYECDGVPRS